MNVANPSPAPALRRALEEMFARYVPVQHLSSPDVLAEVASRWCELQRCWHGPEHIMTMLPKAAQAAEGEDQDALVLAAVYHDVVYNPRASDNEERSAALLVRHAADPDAPVVQRACEMILDSKWAQIPSSALGRIFFDLDTEQLSDDYPTRERLHYERTIFREYQWVPWRTYFEKRNEFLTGWAQRFPQHKKGTKECADLLWALEPSVAVYPGSFHPFHLGHWSILRRAEQTFDKVIVALGINRQKAGNADSLEARRQALGAQLPFHEVVAFDGLLSEYLGDMEYMGTVVRGVRDGTDLEAELRYARFLNDLSPDTAVVWISCEPPFQHLSSSALRELAAIKPGAESRYIPTASQIYGLDGEVTLPAHPTA